MSGNDIEGRPTVSVCVPMYNNGATIARCLNSILDQDGVDFEIVVVDDDSTDDCAATAAAMLRPQDRLVRNAPRLGLNGNHNKCVEVARGELIQFVHGDDWLLPGALATLASCFDDADVGMAFAPRKVETDDHDFQRQYGVLHTHFKTLDAHNDGPALVRQMAARGGLHNWIGEPTCVMFRRRLALEAGGFRDDVYQLVDLDIWYRLMLRSSVGFVPRELSVRTHTAATESARNLSMRRYWLDQLRILTWLAVDPASSAGVRTLAGLWWPVAWLSLLQAVVWGPQRWTSLKTFSQAPFREFARARRFRASLTQPR
ncbi:glycosyltransferase family 2 protein [Mycobacterium asiaticum]|uniref:glycosyltransferase family 2 protein n=1 Tax=Mycobacterium asiaticum TaxID=1790 RepID=UPI0007EF23E7|nr:glycosyltransferase [Mycobacterium asiaticum]OBJ55164.1 hypothetical protein A9W94_20340 [Mycobacterium asiaticum]